jgi:hypothetical protein
VGAVTVWVCASFLVVIIELRTKGRDGSEVAVETAIGGWAEVDVIHVTGTTRNEYAIAMCPARPNLVHFNNLFRHACVVCLVSPQYEHLTSGA